MRLKRVVPKARLRRDALTAAAARSLRPQVGTSCAGSERMYDGVPCVRNRSASTSITSVEPCFRATRIASASKKVWDYARFPSDLPQPKVPNRATGSRQADTLQPPSPAPLTPAQL